jgi:hypothetical protein
MYNKICGYAAQEMLGDNPEFTPIRRPVTVLFGKAHASTINSTDFNWTKHG